MNRRVLAALLAASVLLAPAPARSAAGAETELEKRLQAAFILQFAKFVEWPAAPGRNAASAPDAPFVITVVDDRALHDQLAALAKDKLIRGHKVSLRLVSAAPGENPGQILVIKPEHSEAVDGMLQKAKDCGCLTVTYRDGKGSVINFFQDEDRLRFEINRKAAKEQKLEISSQLLELARIVE